VISIHFFSHNRRSYKKNSSSDKYGGKYGLHLF
jgi:hypothetical protein